MGVYFSVWGLILTTGLESVHPHSLPETTSKLPWIPIQFERIRYTKSRDVTWFGPAWPMTCRMTSVGLSHRITWTQRRLLCFQSWSITSDPGLGPLVFIQSRVDTQPPPPLRCRVTFNLSSEKTSLPPLNALNYPAGLPAGLVFPTMPFLSMGQFWRRDYSPCIRKITATHPPPPPPHCVGSRVGELCCLSDTRQQKIQLFNHGTIQTQREATHGGFYIPQGEKWFPHFFSLNVTN